MKRHRIANFIRTLIGSEKRPSDLPASQNDAFNPDATIEGPRGQAIEAAKHIRGPGRGPTVVILGVLPRSGTVYTGELLSLHPDLHPFPNDMWETPLLELAGDIFNLNKKYLASYRPNAGKIATSDFIPLFASAFLAYMHQFAPAGKRLLLKRPRVDYLQHFFSMFPFEHLLLVIRDGRDVVASTVRSWPQVDFANTCKRWDKGAKMIRAFCRENQSRPEGFYFQKYEDIFQNPTDFVKNACRCFDLDVNKYPFESIKTIPLKGSSSSKIKGKVTWEAANKGNNFKPIGRWKEWTPKEKATFKNIAGQSLIAAGYCKDLNW